MLNDQSENRNLSQVEFDLICKLLSFAGLMNGTLAKKLRKTKINEIDEFGSIKFLEPNIVLNKRNNLLASAFRSDTDTIGNIGPFVRYLLFARENALSELQIYKDDGQKILSPLIVAEVEEELSDPRGLRP